MAAAAFAYQPKFVQRTFSRKDHDHDDEPTTAEIINGVDTLTISREALEMAIAQKEFQRLANDWRSSRNLISSADDEICQDSLPYQQIIGLGPPAVTLLLREINRDEPEPWFWALAAITRENPVPPESQGNLRATRDAWLRWGINRKLINVEDLGK